MLTSFNLGMLLSSPAAQPFTIWRNPAATGGKRGQPAQVGVIERGIITPVLGSSGRGGGELVNPALLAGLRSPHPLFAPGALDIRNGYDIKQADGTHYEVQHAGIWGGDGMTMAVLSKPEGGTP